MTITDNGLYLTIVDGTQTNDIFKSLIQGVVTNGTTAWIVYRYANDRTNMHCSNNTDTNANVLVIDYNDVTAPVVASGAELRAWILTTISSGGVTHEEDTAHTSGDIGYMPLAVRNDAGTSLVDTDLDYAPLMVNANGMLNTNLDNIRDAVPDIGAGDNGSGTLRVDIANDNINQVAIKTSVELIDDGIYTDGAGTPVKGMLIMGTDGTNPQAVNVDVDGRIVLSSDIEIGAVELKDGTSEARQSVKVDNETATATPTVALTGGIYKATLDTYGDNDASPLHMNVNGELKVAMDSDIQIGSVEIKNATSDDRVIVTAANTARAVGDMTLLTQVVDESAGVLKTSVIETNSVTIAGDTTNIDDAVTALNTAPSMASSTAYEASNVAKATAGILYAVWGYNSLASTQYIQVHNTAALPADTAIPIIIFKVDASDNFYFDIGGSFGITCATGITVCNSSTGATKTIGAADCWFNVSYK